MYCSSCAIFKVKKGHNSRTINDSSIFWDISYHFRSFLLPIMKSDITEQYKGINLKTQNN